LRADLEPRETQDCQQLVFLVWLVKRVTLDYLDVQDLTVSPVKEVWLVPLASLVSREIE
jgi:hypothetical protein